MLSMFTSHTTYSFPFSHTAGALCFSTTITTCSYNNKGHQLGKSPETGIGLAGAILEEELSSAR